MKLDDCCYALPKSCRILTSNIMFYTLETANHGKRTRNVMTIEKFP
jgi:hypothetical protein